MKTLQNFINGKKVTLTTKFHYPKSGNFNEIVNVFEKEVIENKNITLFSSGVMKMDQNEKGLSTIHLDDGCVLTTNSLVWASDLKSLLEINKIEHQDLFFDKTSVSLVFCKIEKSEINNFFSTLYVCKDESFVYRITNLDKSSGRNEEKQRIVFELNKEVLFQHGIQTNEQILEHLNKFIEKYAIFKEKLDLENSVVKNFDKVINLPTEKNYLNFIKLFNLVTNNIQTVELIGPSSGFVSTSFNDQVVQALKIGKKYNSICL